MSFIKMRSTSGIVIDVDKIVAFKQVDPPTSLKQCIFVVTVYICGGGEIRELGLYYTDNELMVRDYERLVEHVNCFAVGIKD